MSIELSRLKDIFLSEKGKFVQENIKFTKNVSDTKMERLRLTFANDYGISIIFGYGSYGYEKGLFEIAPLNKNNELDRNLVRKIASDDSYDEVIGYLTLDEVIDYCNKIINIKE
jgi:hypothetical protein